MSRYDRNRSKKSNNTAFIVAVLISLFIGISGTYYVLDNFKKFKEAEVTVSDKAPSKEAAVTTGLSEEEQVPTEDESEIVPAPAPAPAPVGPDTLANNNEQPVVQKSRIPDLLSSDDSVRQALFKFSPGLAQWLTTDQLIRKYVHIANDFAQGLRINKHMGFLRLEEPFSVEQDKNGSFIAAKSFQRYDKLAQAIQVINMKGLAVFYYKFRPLMVQVFAEFSYPPDITLESIVRKAAAEVLAAPAIEGQIPLVRPAVHYKFADAKLEALSPVQKQLIRMGPVNTRIIQTKCREFLVELAKSGV